jgi:SAM-dependent methyltransferase
MALGLDVLEAIVREHSFRPIVGNVVLIGPQTVNLSRGDVLELMHQHGIVAASPDSHHTTDTRNEAGATGDAEDTISAAAFFQLLGVNELRTIDAPTKGAIDDLAEQHPNHLKDCADFVVDGGTLVDNYSPASVLSSYAKLLRPGGRLIAINNMSSHFDPYSIPSEIWYLDYFVVNGFADCKVYVLVYFPNQLANAFYLDIDCLLDPNKGVRNVISPYEMSVIVFAEKGIDSTTHMRPSQAQYRSTTDWSVYRDNLRSIKSSLRPHLVRSRREMSFSEVRGGYLFMGSDYVAAEPSGEGRRLNRRASGENQSGKDESRLRILCVGTGRDGTQSLNYMIQRVLTASGDLQTMHEYCCREICQAFCDLKETSDDSCADALKRMVAGCPYDCIVGHGYAEILPLFAQHYGRGLKVVHLRRDDRDACIASLVRNSELFPTAYGYYSSSPSAVVKRMAAFHFGEMSQAEWNRLPVEKKFGWYYDKTHELVRQHLPLFDNHIEITTESLDNEASRRTIAQFTGGGDIVTPPKAHLNASVIDIASFPKEHQHKMHWLMGRLNIEELASDEVYAIDYFLDKFVAWTGYQISDAPQLSPARPASAHKIAADLERAKRIIESRLREIDSLHQRVSGRGAKDTK